MLVDHVSECREAPLREAQRAGKKAGHGGGGCLTNQARLLQGDQVEQVARRVLPVAPGQRGGRPADDAAALGHQRGVIGQQPARVVAAVVVVVCAPHWRRAAVLLPDTAVRW